MIQKSQKDIKIDENVCSIKNNFIVAIKHGSLTIPNMKQEGETSNTEQQKL